MNLKYLPWKTSYQKKSKTTLAPNLKIMRILSTLIMKKLLLTM
jgi:hypothetical protein